MKQAMVGGATILLLLTSAAESKGGGHTSHIRLFTEHTTSLDLATKHSSSGGKEQSPSHMIKNMPLDLNPGANFGTGWGLGTTWKVK